MAATVLPSDPWTPFQSTAATTTTTGDRSRESSPSSSSSCSSSHLRVPIGDSPYCRAKHVQLVEKDPTKAVPLFWAAINGGDRVDSALKDMAVVMKQVNRADEAIEAIKSFRGLCSNKAQEPLDNVLLDLYKKCGRIHDQIELLSFKLKAIDLGLAFGGKRTKLARSQGKKFHVSIDQERARLLGNLAWAYMQSENYKEAEPVYRQALAIEPDDNKQCNLAICLMQTGQVSEAKSLLQAVRKPSGNGNSDPHEKSFERASEMLKELCPKSIPHRKREEIQLEVQNTPPASNSRKLLSELSSPSPSEYFTPKSDLGKGKRRYYEEPFCSSVANGESKQEIKEPQTVTRSLVGANQKSEAPIRFQAAIQVMENSAKRSHRPAHSSTAPKTADNIPSSGLSSDALSQGFMAVNGERRGKAKYKNRAKHSSSLTFEETVTSGSWKNGCSQNSDGSITFLGESRKPKRETSGFSSGRRTHANVVEKEGHLTAKKKQLKPLPAPVPSGRKEEMKLSEFSSPSSSSYFTPQSDFRRGRRVYRDSPIHPTVLVNGNPKHENRELRTNAEAIEGLKSDVLSGDTMAMDVGRRKREGKKDALLARANGNVTVKAPSKQSSSLPSDEKASFGTWKNDGTQSSDSSLASICNSSKPKEESSVFRHGRIGSDMAEEEKEEKQFETPLIHNEDHGAAVKCQGRLEAMAYPVDDVNQQPDLPIKPLIPLAISQSKAEGGLRSDVLSHASMARDEEIRKRDAWEYMTKDTGNEKTSREAPNEHNRIYISENITFGSLNYEYSQSSDSSFTSKSKSLKPEEESRVSTKERRTWADMVEEEEEHYLASEVEEEKQEEQFNSVLKKGRRTWADMVEEEEEHCLAAKVEGEKQEEQFNSLLKKGRRTWADIADEEEEEEQRQKFANKNIYNGGPRSAVPSGRWDHHDEVFADENVNCNILVSSRKHRHDSEWLCQKLDKVDPREGKTPGSSWSARRSLSFKHEEWSKRGMNTKAASKGNRLQVFRDITFDEGSRD